MRFMQLVRVDPDVDPGPDTDATPWVEGTTARGIRLWGDRVRPEADATTVRRRGVDRLVTDGPFAESPEQIAGFDVLEVADISEAVTVAAAHPVARFGALEIRPLMPFGDPELDAARGPVTPHDGSLTTPPEGWRTYLMLMGTDADAPPPDVDFTSPQVRDRWRGQMLEWLTEGVRRGLVLDGSALEGPERTKTVRVRDGMRLVVDGPFAGAREHVAGYNLIQAPSIDEAIELAATHPAGAIGPIELRPLWPM